MNLSQTARRILFASLLAGAAWAGWATARPQNRETRIRAIRRREPLPAEWSNPPLIVARRREQGALARLCAGWF